LRPLLSLTKRQIQFLANQLEIPFVVDQSNFDEKVSKRNLLRNKILPELFALGNGEDKFLESMEYVYEDIEECCELHTEEGSKAALDLVKIEIVPEWGAEF
jgi:tRNA(Ile)-lysidine synthase TilS/MesJ